MQLNAKSRAHRAGHDATGPSAASSAIAARRWPTYDEHGRLIELAGWRWDETGRILADPHTAVEEALRRWGDPASAPGEPTV
jgi:LDH2 family malate/lactate/ureidoglycolate dehydrogenase